MGIKQLIETLALFVAARLAIALIIIAVVIFTIVIVVRRWTANEHMCNQCNKAGHSVNSVLEHSESPPRTGEFNLMDTRDTRQGNGDSDPSIPMYSLHVSDALNYE